MKKSFVTIGVIALVAVVCIMWSVGIYNNLVSKDEGVKNNWAQVENQYQRRADLIPNLVETVKGYAKHEQETFQAVIEARSKATQTNINPENLDEASLKKFADAQGDLSQALGKLMVVVENYPQLKANENFMTLQAQLEGTENRIAVERKRFNDAANDYNAYRRRFPNNLFAGMFGFESKAYFEAEKGAETAPKVSF